jgi:three-Cys-motif partner protein
MCFLYRLRRGIGITDRFGRLGGGGGEVVVDQHRHQPRDYLPRCLRSRLRSPCNPLHANDHVNCQSAIQVGTFASALAGGTVRTQREERVPEEGLQLFGGDWTEQKLDALDQYLRAYAKVLSNQPFERVYIDAFAGTGYRERRASGPTTQALLLGDLAAAEPQRFLDGSARIALRIDPPFHRYVFVERHRRRARELRRLKDEFTSLAASIEVQALDANTAIQKLCADWDVRRMRGVLFLDPFGMQVDWATVQGVARTQAIDVWILFPFMVNRLLTRSPSKILPAWRQRLTRMLGSPEWLNRFYPEKKLPTMFSSQDDVVVEKALTFEGLGSYYLDRLRSTFPMVAPNPRVLRNTRNAPLFQLFFAAANPARGGEIAVKIAKHILDRI